MTFKRYHIPTAVAPQPKELPGKFLIARDVEHCINCGVCEDACVYGVHGRQALDPRLMETPKTKDCTGCFRCVMECPVGVLTLTKHPEFLALGNDYVTPAMVRVLWNEATDGRVPVSGQGYRGPFSGPGFDNVWTDMSEIVRPTRDGIHGREYISTAVDLGRKLPFVPPDDGANPPPLLEIPVPFLFNPPPLAWRRAEVQAIVAEAATRIGTFSIVNAPELTSHLKERQVVPRWGSGETVDADAAARASLIELDLTPQTLDVRDEIKAANPKTIVSIRLPLTPNADVAALDLVRAGAEVLHLYGDAFGREWAAGKPRFLTDALRAVDERLVEEGVRDEVTIVASGGIVASEHVPKAILCGADAVAVDATYMVALGWGSNGTPPILDLDLGWAVRRILNWANACRDQLLEVLGAMGMRDIRRLSGETGRAMFADELEREFAALFGGERRA